MSSDASRSVVTAPRRPGATTTTRSCSGSASPACAPAAHDRQRPGRPEVTSNPLGCESCSDPRSIRRRRKQSPMILIMTGHREDPTVLAVERALASRGADVLTVDALTLERAGIGVPFTLDVPDRDARSVSADDVSAAFLWRSTVPNAHSARLDEVRDDPNALGFVLAQW